MKKKYMLITGICIGVLIAIVVLTAVMLSKDYFDELSYDHMSDTVYNGIEVVGEDGLFYLVKDGKKLSDGYVSLKSVNDYYEPSLYELYKDGKNAVIYDYYIAKAADRSNYLLVNSSGEEFTVMGDNYSLHDVALPYLIFINNTTARMAAISLERLDSDVSYKSGSELTLRPFKEISPFGRKADSVTYTYLHTVDITDEYQESYFRSDGIKITSGANISELALYKKNDTEPHIFFYQSDDAKIYSPTGELVASEIIGIYRSGYSDWRYAICKNEETGSVRAVVFSPNNCFTLLPDSYDTSGEINDLGSCIIAARADGTGRDVINVTTTQKSTYRSVTVNGNVICATREGENDCYYLNENGELILKSAYADMIAQNELSTEYCTVFSSAAYDAANGGTFLHFANAGENVYSYNTSGKAIRTLQAEDIEDTSVMAACYLVTSVEADNTRYSILTPFAQLKESASYDTVTAYKHGGIAWILAASYDKKTYDVIDPLSSKTVGSIPCGSDDFAKLAFTHDGNTALATDRYDTDTTVPMCIIKLSKYESDDLISYTRYFAIYRSATYKSNTYFSTALQFTEIGKNLIISNPYDVYTAENYLVTHTSLGSVVFALDEACMLGAAATLPYRVTDITVDRANPDTKYFRVETDDGMCGLYNTESYEVLSPYYSAIENAENGYFTVRQRGACGVVRLEGTKTETVIDFLYTDIFSLGDNGYIAVNGDGAIHVYSGKKQVLSESVQSYSSVYSYNCSDDGELSVSIWALLSSDARLYIHRSSLCENLSRNSYYPSEDIHTGELNVRAKAVYYYDGEKLFDTAVIYHNSESFELAESPEELGWYLSRSENAQTEPVTADSILAHSGNIIRLYSKNK